MPRFIEESVCIELFFFERINMTSSLLNRLLHLGTPPSPLDPFFQPYIVALHNLHSDTRALLDALNKFDVALDTIVSAHHALHRSMAHVLQKTEKGNRVAHEVMRPQMEQISGLGKVKETLAQLEQEMRMQLERQEVIEKHASEVCKMRGEVHHYTKKVETILLKEQQELKIIEKLSRNQCKLQQVKEECMKIEQELHEELVSVVGDRATCYLSVLKKFNNAQKIFGELLVDNVRTVKLPSEPIEEDAKSPSAQGVRQNNQSELKDGEQMQYEGDQTLSNIDRQSHKQNLSQSVVESRSIFALPQALATSSCSTYHSKRLASKPSYLDSSNDVIENDNVATSSNGIGIINRADERFEPMYSLQACKELHVMHRVEEDDMEENESESEHSR